MPQKPSELENQLIQRAIQEQLHQNPQPVPGQLPPRPATYKPDPLVVGTDLAKKAHRYFNLAPELKNNVSIVNRGPTPGTMRVWELLNSVNLKTPIARQDPAAVMDSHIAGYYGADKGDIFVSPAAGENPQMARINMGDETANTSSILLHELSHAAGYDHESSVPSLMERLGIDQLEPKGRWRDAKTNAYIPPKLQPKKLDK